MTVLLSEKQWNNKARICADQANREVLCLLSAQHEEAAILNLSTERRCGSSQK